MSARQKERSGSIFALPEMNVPPVHERTMRGLVEKLYEEHTCNLTPGADFVKRANDAIIGYLSQRMNLPEYRGIVGHAVLILMECGACPDTQQRPRYKR